MEKSRMLDELIAHYENGNKARFASRLGVRPQTINSWQSRNSYDAELIFAKCEGVSGDWLLSGKGAMISGDTHIADAGEMERTIARLAIENTRLKERIAELEGRGAAVAG